MSAAARSAAATPRMPTRRIALLVLAALLCAPVLSGCGDQAEIPRKGFVMGVALDSVAAGTIRVTVQIFKPAQSVAGRRIPEKSVFNIQTEDESFIEAVRDITLHLGRKAQWSHTRMILIGERLARQYPLVSLLDFLYRDHEPRLTTHMLITQGEAARYLGGKPYIENSISQQFFLSEQGAHDMTGKSIKANLLDLAMQTRSPSGVALVPYVFDEDDNGGASPTVAGAAVLVGGKLNSVVPASLFEGVLFLKGDYRSGIVEVPCGSNPSAERLLSEDSLELLKVKTAMKERREGDHVHLEFRLRAVAAISELVCGQAMRPRDESKLKQRLERKLEQMMRESMDWLLANRLDAVGAGNKLFQRHPRLWKTWQADWPQRFARATYEVRAEAIILTSGTNAGKPLNEK